MTSAWVPGKATPFSQGGEGTASRAVPLSFSIARAWLIATLLLAPLAFGAVQSWYWAALAVAAAFLLLLWAIGCVQQGAIRTHWSPLYIPAALFLVLGMVQYAANCSFNGYATWESLIKFVTDLVFFFLADQLWAAAPTKAWERFGLVVTLYAFSMSLFAIIQFFSSHGLIYWKVKTQGSTFGPYVNHDDYAGLLEMLIPIAAVYVLSRARSRGERAFLSFATIVSVCSVLLSGSRGGLIVLLAESIILMAVFYKQSTGTRPRSVGMIVTLGTGAVALLFFWLAPAHISKRLATVAGLMNSPEVTLGERWIVWKDSLGIIRNHPLMGTGLGTFEVSFPRHQSFASDLVWDHAHNDYVEALAETGIVGGILMVLALIFFFKTAFKDLTQRLRHEEGWIQLGAALGVCGLLVHSVGDFNLHIPANAAWFAMCAAIATTSARHQGYRSPESDG